MLEQFGLSEADILLPSEECDLSKWAVIACDQFTSQPEYWEKVTRLVGDAPSTLNLIYPEVWLDQGDARIARIHSAMRAYERDVLTRHVHGCILVERTIASGTRLGLATAVDLEKYDFSADSTSLIRASEGTILSRIPPRVKIRKGAPLELPHILLLVDDPLRTLIEPLYERHSADKPLYDVELMLGGGHLRGWHVEPGEEFEAALWALWERAHGLLFAVGDGNHSLATAKQCWLDIRETLTEEERQNHPARFALVEINNLHDEALVFEPIHRVIFGVNREELIADFAAWAEAQGMPLADCDKQQAMFRFVQRENVRLMRLENCAHPLPLAILQRFLDEWMMRRTELRLDYIHGEDAVNSLSNAADAVGILVPAMDKHVLFEAVRVGGALPRKTFSMGEAVEKRYYMECRRLEL